jgi:hypothetical protein
MSLPLKSQVDLYDLFISTLQDEFPALTDTSDGSLVDGLGGTFSVAGLELQRYNILQFNKLFFSLANGPEITGGPDDLQTLAVDRYGSAFARPGATDAIDTAIFTRPNNNAGEVDIPEGTVIQTQPDANGNVYQYATNEDVSLIDAGSIGFTVESANATSGAVYKDSLGNSYTVASTIVAGVSLATTGTTLPPASGTLTKFSGTGDATILFSARSAPDCRVIIGVTALVAGSASNAVAGALNVISSTLLDPTILVTNEGNATGEDALDDADYRALIYNLIASLRAATQAAIVATALTVSGVVVAVPVLVEQAVVNWNIATNAPQDDAIAGKYQWFYIPYVTLYIADVDGGASGALIAAVQAAIAPYEAFGVNITVAGATPVTVDWTGSFTLNPEGPNYSLFSVNTVDIISAMTNYINTLGVGNNFVRTTANAAIMAIYGPDGTNDLTGFTTSVPTGDVTVTTPETAFAGVVQTV